MGGPGKSINLMQASGKSDGVGRSRAFVFFLLVLVFPLMWRWTPLHDWINFETILEWQDSLKKDPAAPFLVAGAYLIGSLFFFPVTILNLATVFAFGPVWGNVYSLAGWLLGASETYFIGRLFERYKPDRLAETRLGRFIEQAERHGFWTVLMLRVFPVGPFTLVNLLVGASGIRFCDFFLASLVGRLPGVLTLTLFGIQLERLLRKPGLTGFALLVFILIMVPFAISRLIKHLANRPAS